jgi:lipopolysaccharide/colanic/teichoic acid biosynthesis glycosyltransferase
MTPTSLVTTQDTLESTETMDSLMQPAFAPIDQVSPDDQADSSWGSRLSQRFKQASDFVVAAILVALASPLFLITALFIKVTSPGPVFYVQERIGKSGLPFRFYKFRTMRHDCDDSSHRDFARNFIQGSGTNGNGNGSKAAAGEPRDGGKTAKTNGKATIYKMTADPRVTSIGKLLRRTSLDELPQIINVLRGEMSMVGPRPPVPYEVEHYQEWHKRRLSAKPGITGLWQVSGRSSVPFDEMVLLDLYYIENRSTAMDLRIMARTLPVMVKGDGAY